MEHVKTDQEAWDAHTTRDAGRPLPSLPEDKWWGLAAHASALVSVPLANVVGPLVIAIGRRESPFVAEEARAALNFQLTMLLLYAATVPFFVIIVTWWLGMMLWWAIGVMNLVFVLLAALRSLGGNGYRYPFSLEPVTARHVEVLGRWLER